MRILMLSQFYPPYIGGEERVTQNLSKMLVDRGHSVSVATLGNDQLPSYEDDNGIHLYRLRSVLQRVPWLFSDADRPHLPPMPDIGITHSLRHIIDEERPEIVHAHNWIVHSFLPLKSRSGAKLVLSLHDYSLICATKKLIHRNRYDVPCSGPSALKCLGCAREHYGVMKAVATVGTIGLTNIFEKRTVDLFLPVSQAVAKGSGLADAGLPYVVLPNFIPDEHRSDSDSDEEYLSQLPAQPFLLFVGAFGAYKGVDTLLNAYKDLEDVPPLVLIGYSTTEHPVEAKELPANVVLLRDWPHSAVMEAWHRCAIAIVPSRWAEPRCLVALEAMKASRPVIASRIGGLPEDVIDGETGILVPPGDVHALREALLYLVSHPELQLSLGTAGEKHLRRIAAEKVVTQLESLYIGLLTANDATDEMP